MRHVLLYTACSSVASSDSRRICLDCSGSGVAGYEMHTSWQAHCEGKKTGGQGLCGKESLDYIYLKICLQNARGIV